MIMLAGFLSIDLALLSLLGAAAAEPPPGTDPVTVTLEEVIEVRQLALIRRGENDMPSMFDQPKLELRYGIELAEGRKLVDLRQPTSVRASDSSGTDLSKVKPNIFGRHDFVQTIAEWDATPHAFTLTLAPAARSATSFSLATRMDAVTYLDTRTLTVSPTGRWSPLRDEALGDQEVTMRLITERQSTRLAFRPVSVRDLIEKVTLAVGPRQLESEGVMWSGDEVGYMFSGAVKADEAVKAQLTLRLGLLVVPVELEIKDQPLP
jgi:hypothetical protein